MFFLMYTGSRIILSILVLRPVNKHILFCDKLILQHNGLDNIQFINKNENIMVIFFWLFFILGHIYTGQHDISCDLFDFVN